MDQENTLYAVTPLGPMTLVTDGKGLCSVQFDSPTEEGDRTKDKVIFTYVPATSMPGPLEQAKLWLGAYFTHTPPQELPALPPVTLSGSDFQRLIWQLLCQIPYGSTLSYGELAKRAAEISGKSVSARAVGMALSKNPVLLILPCHRVIGAYGALHGYAGGVWRKQWLLDYERNMLTQQ